MGVSPDADDARERQRSMPLVSILFPPGERQTLSGEALPGSAMDIATQMISSGSAHLATPLTGAMCLAAAAAVPGSLVNEIADRSFPDAPPLTLAHPSGTMRLAPVVRFQDGAPAIDEIAIFRTARRLMDGRVYVPAALFETGEAAPTNRTTGAEPAHAD